MNLNWSKYRPLTKLDQLAETIMKTAFIMSENHHVIQSYVEHKGANFRIINRVGDSFADSRRPQPLASDEASESKREFDVLCRQINIEKTNYAFISKKDLEQGLRNDLYIGLVIFIDGQKPTKYLIPSTVWNNPGQLFTDSSVKHSEYGINLNSKTMKEFVENYAFESQIQYI